MREIKREIESFSDPFVYKVRKVQIMCRGYRMYIVIDGVNRGTANSMGIPEEDAKNLIDAEAK